MDVNKPISPRIEKHIPEKKAEEAGFMGWLIEWVEKFMSKEAEPVSGYEESKKELLKRLAEKAKKTEGRRDALTSSVGESSTSTGIRLSRSERMRVERKEGERLEFKALKLDVPEDSFSEDLIDGYNERIYENQLASWDIIFTKLEKDVFKGFDRKVYEGDPMRFMMDLGANERAVEIFKDLTWEDEVFGNAWDAIRDERIKYFQELVEQQYSDDPVYKKAVARYDELNEIRNETLDELYGTEGGMGGDSDLIDEFEEQFGEEYDQLCKYLHEKNTAYFNGMAVMYYAKDKEFQHALKVVQFEKEKLKLEDPEMVVEGLYEKYRTDEEFKKCIDCINDREAKLRNLFYFVYSEEDVEERRAIVSPRFDWVTLGSEAKKVKDFVQENPGVIITPAVGLAAFVLGSPVTVPAYAVGGVFAYHFVDKAIAPVLKQANKVGVDLKTAKEDREVRMPHLEKIFTLEVTDKEKINFMNQLHENGLLFVDDLYDIDEDLRAEFLEGIEGGEKGLLFLDEVVEGRRPLLKILNDPYASEGLKIDALERLYRGGLLYKSDVDQHVIDASVKGRFFEKVGINEGDLRDMKALKPWRNAALFLIRGKDLGADEKLKELKELHKKGLLFREDVRQLEQTIGGKKLVERFYKEVKISYEDLAELATHYKWNKSDLRKADDQKRVPYLKMLESVDKKEQIEGLRGLQKMGLCFKQDLDKVMDDVRIEFGKEVKLDELPDRISYYRVGMGERFVKVISPKKAIGGAAVIGGTAMMAGMIPGGGFIAAGLIAGGVIGGFPDVVDDPAKIVVGALAGVKGVVQITAEAMDATFGTFLYETKAMQERVVKVLPTNAKIKEQATFATNKVISGMKWGVLGAAIGSQIAGIFGVKIGFAVGSFFGFCSTNGRVKQVPPGGFIRAIKFSGVGAMVGSLVPVVVGLVLGGLAIGGLVAASTAITVASMGLGLIIPCLLLGAFAGYQIAGLTGKDEELNVEDPVAKRLEYKVPTFEVAKALLLA